MSRKPKILYYSNGQTQKEKAIEKTARRLGADFISISETDCAQTVGYLAKVKGFPVHKISILENLSAICQDVMILCYFPNTSLDLLLASIRNGETPAVDLKAILTPQNCFWTFSQLYQELLEEHLSLFSNQE